ncbi:glycosyltransferase [Polaribacter staleyi]|uniref:glycosyltransferase n=1 Tax=Polaribacter staleyi TaxID=2022337 RepID=UPI0031BAEEA1
MTENVTLTATIVLYNENLSSLKKTIDSFLKINLDKKLFLIDNSPSNTLQKHFISPEIEYVFVGKNIGFGSAHNLVLDKVNSQFHLVLNPDIEFDSLIIPILISKLEEEKEVAFITPKVLYPNNKMQFVCRKFPTLFNLINRRIKLSKKEIYKNEYRDLNLEKSFYPDFIHGCFMLFNTGDFMGLKGFDERYFLYMEDVDICRKIDIIGKKILYFPEVKIIHQHQKGSSKSLKLFFRHTSSVIKYFTKWGF